MSGGDRNRGQCPVTHLTTAFGAPVVEVGMFELNRNPENFFLDVDYFSQPRALFRLLTPDKRQLLFENTDRAMGDAPDYGAGVAKALGMAAGAESVPAE